MMKGLLSDCEICVTMWLNVILPYNLRIICVCVFVCVCVGMLSPPALLIRFGPNLVRVILGQWEVTLSCHITLQVTWPQRSKVNSDKNGLIVPKVGGCHPWAVGSDLQGVMWPYRSFDHRGQRSNLAKLVQLYSKLPRVILRQWGVISMGSYDLGVKGQVTTEVRGQIWPNWSIYTQNCPESSSDSGEWSTWGHMT